jgi:uncharacterized protein YegP (UPF0339 family)
MNNKYIKHESQDGQYYFTLIAGNGEVIATSEMYRTKAGRDKGIRSVKANAGRYETLERRVHKWAKDRGIHDKSTAIIQAKYALKEIKELIDALERGDEFEAVDGIGDSWICLVNTARLMRVNTLDCFEAALIEIEGRQGSMINGEFVRNK